MATPVARSPSLDRHSGDVEADAGASFDSEDWSIVVSGSWARNEFTRGSDIDWTPLVDGSADPKHHDLVREIGLLGDSMAGKSTGAEGTFGS